MLVLVPGVPGQIGLIDLQKKEQVDWINLPLTQLKLVKTESRFLTNLSIIDFVLLFQSHQLPIWNGKVEVQRQKLIQL